MSLYSLRLWHLSALVHDGSCRSLRYFNSWPNSMWVFAVAQFAQFPVWSAAGELLGAWLALAPGLSQSWRLPASWAGAARLECCQRAQPAAGLDGTLCPLRGRRVMWVPSSRCGSRAGWACRRSCCCRALRSPYLFPCVCWRLIVNSRFPLFFVGLSLVFLLTQIFRSVCQLLITPNSGLMTFLCLGIVLYLHHNRAL